MSRTAACVCKSYFWNSHMSRREHQQLSSKRGKVHKKRTLSALPCICQFSTAFALFVLSCIFVLLIIFAVLYLWHGVSMKSRYNFFFITVTTTSSSPLSSRSCRLSGRLGRECNHYHHHHHRHPHHHHHHHHDQGDCVVGLCALVTRVDKIYTERARTACQQYALLIIMIIVMILIIIIIITIIIEIMIIIAAEKTAHPQQRDLGQNANNQHQWSPSTSRYWQEYKMYSCYLSPDYLRRALPKYLANFFSQFFKKAIAEDDIYDNDDTCPVPGGFSG